MTTEELRNKRRRGGTAQPSSTEVQSSQVMQPIVLDLDAIRAMFTQELQTALDPILDALAMLVTETRKTRVELGASLHCLPIGLQLTEDEASEEEWLEDEEGVEQGSEATEGANYFPNLHQRGLSRPGRTQFRAGLPVKEPEMLEILPRRREEVK